MEFLFGQRVIYSHQEIVTVIQAPQGKRSDQWSIWVEQQNGVQLRVSKGNLKPLPNRQL